MIDRSLELLRIGFGSNSSKNIAENERAYEVKNSCSDGQAAKNAYGSFELAITGKLSDVNVVRARIRLTGLDRGCQEACRKDEKATSGLGQEQEVEGPC
jgi:hypothetical protein